nr:hypothetical protein [Tanacetum cinerariifolium]
HWGRKRQQFYSFAVNRESSLDIYSKRRIIAVIELKIVEWHNYKHLDWISDKKKKLMRIDELYKFSDGTLNDVRNSLDDRLKGIRMQYLPTTIWRRGDKAKAAAMIQAIYKMLKTRRIMRRKVLLMLEILSRRFFLKLNPSDHRSILTDLQGTLKGKWRYLIPAITPIHNHVLIPNYQDFKIQDFRYSDGFECFQAINIGRYEHVSPMSLKQKKDEITR